MAKSIALAADASRRASLLLSYIPAVCAFVAPRQPRASTAIIDRLSHSRALRLLGGAFWRRVRGQDRGQQPLGVFDGQSLRCPGDVSGYPARKRRCQRAMGAALAVLLGDLSHSRSVEPGNELDQRRPQPTVHVSHLAVDQLAHEHVRVSRNGRRQREDLMALRVPPPAPLERSACDVLGKAGHGTTRCLQHHAVLSDERECLFRRHEEPPERRCLVVIRQIIPRRLNATRVEPATSFRAERQTRSCSQRTNT